MATKTQKQEIAQLQQTIQANTARLLELTGVAPTQSVSVATNSPPPKFNLPAAPSVIPSAPVSADAPKKRGRKSKEEVKQNHLAALNAGLTALQNSKYKDSSALITAYNALPEVSRNELWGEFFNALDKRVQNKLSEVLA